MATVIGLNKKFQEACEGTPPVPAGADPLVDPGSPAKPGFLDQSPANKVALAAFLQAQEQHLKPLEATDQSRSAAITHLQKHLPENAAQLESIKRSFASRHKELIGHMQNFHEREYEGFELELERLGVSQQQQRPLLEGLRQAQQVRMVALEERGKSDQEHLTTLAEDRDKAFSAASILGNLNPGKDPNDPKGKEENSASALVERWRAPIWPKLKAAIMKLPGGVGEKFQELTGEDPELFNQPGEVEAKFAKRFSMKGFKEHQATGVSNYKAETLGMEDEDAGSLDDDWAAANVDRYFDNEKKHVYSDLGAAGVFRRRGLLSPFGSAGEFTITEEPIPYKKKLDIPKAEKGLTCKCAGNVTKAQKLVRLGVLAHEAMARGWKAVNLAHMPEEWRDEAYLALRRAGFRHDQIKVSGALFTSVDLQNRGSEQRKRIEDQFKKDLSPVQMQKLALQTQNPDQSLDPQEFFSLTPQKQKELFEHAVTTVAQRADIVADPAFDIPTDFPLMQLAVVDKAALINALHDKDPVRAVAAFKAIAPVLNQNDVFKALPAKSAAEIIMAFDPPDQARLFGSLTFDQKITLLQEGNLSSTVVFALAKTLTNPELEQFLNTLIALPVNEAEEVAARLLVGGYKAFIAQGPIPPGGPGPGQILPITLAKVLNYIKDHTSQAKSEAMIAAFINDPGLTSAERVAIIQDVSAYQQTYSNTRLKEADVLNAMSVDNLLLYLSANPIRIPAAGIDDNWLKAQGISAAGKRQELLVRYNDVQGQLGFPGPTTNEIYNFIITNIDEYPDLCAALVRDLPLQQQQNLLVGNVALRLPGVPTAIAKEILERSDDSVIDAVVSKIDASQPGVPDPAGKLLCQLEPERVAKALRKLPNATLLAHHLIDLFGLPDNTDRSKAFQIAREIGATKLGALLAAAPQASRDDLIKGLFVAASAAQAPNDGVKFLAKVLESTFVQRVVFHFTADALKELLPHIHSPHLVWAMLNIDETAQSRSAAEMKQIIDAMPDEAQKAKLFSNVRGDQQIAVLTELGRGQPSHVGHHFEQTLFHCLADANQETKLTFGGPIVEDEANSIIACLSDPKLPKDRREALWNHVEQQRGLDTQILENLTKPTAVFFMTMLETAADKPATFQGIVKNLLEKTPGVRDVCLPKLAHACAAASQSKLPPAVLKTLFVETLAAVVADDNGAAPGVEKLRVQMLDQLVQRGRTAEARSLFNALDGPTKTTLNTAMVQHANASSFKNELLAAVRIGPAAPAPAP
jgi:hypothetical protein